MLHPDSFKDFEVGSGGLFVPKEIQPVEQKPPPRSDRRLIMAQVRRYNRQQKRLKIRKENDSSH